MKVSVFHIIVFGSFVIAQLSAQWENPANRYLDAHEQYLDLSCPLAGDSIKHFVYFARDRELICDHPFLKIERFDGAQIMYAWNQLERAKGVYDFHLIQEDYDYLLAHGKKLFVQLQDATFNPENNGVPSYLLSRDYGGGVACQYSDDGKPDGWVARRWDPQVRKRFALLLEALGEEFDGKIEGINLQETAIGIHSENNPDFTPEKYAEAIKNNMSAMKKAFPESSTMQYANFMTGEWLPWDDKGYLRSVYRFGEEIGVGLGGPDLMFKRKAQLNHALALMHEGDYSVPLGIAIQDGNYIGKTGADKDYRGFEESGLSGRENLVPALHAFARDFLRVQYIFWANQKPYFEEDVIPCFTEN